MRPPHGSLSRLTTYCHAISEKEETLSHQRVSQCTLCSSLTQQQNHPMTQETKTSGYISQHQAVFRLFLSEKNRDELSTGQKNTESDSESETAVRENDDWGGRIRTSAWWYQKPLPYRLATPQLNIECHHMLVYTPIFRQVRKHLIPILHSYFASSFSLLVPSSFIFSRSSLTVRSVAPRSPSAHRTESSDAFFRNGSLRNNWSTISATVSYET